MHQEQAQQPRTNSCLQWFCFKTWYPFDTLRSVLIFSFILGIIFLIVAGVQIFIYLSSSQTSVIYSEQGKCVGKSDNQRCQQIIQVSHDMKPPINVLYVIESAYINHRQYLDSFSDDQISGKTIDMQTAKKKCKPFVTNHDMNKSKSYTGATLESDFVASPCGFKAQLIFNDTFKLYSSDGKQVAIDQTKLIRNDFGEYKKSPDSASKQWIDPQSEHFMVWMQNSARTTKLKLWGRINQVLKAGKYNLVADNHFKIGDMKINKGVTMISPSIFGGALYLYPLIFGLMGLLCIGYAIFLKCSFPDYDDKALQYVRNSQEDHDY